MKKVFSVIIGILAFIIVLSFFKDIIVKASVEKGVEIVTGLPLKIQSFRAGVIKQLVDIKHLRLYNPEGFKDRIMLDAPEIYVDYNLPAIFKGKVHLQDMRINVEEFAVIRNEAGELNLDSLKVVEAQKEGKKPGEKGKAPDVRIDNLELKIGKVIYKDYSGKGVPIEKEYNVNISERYKNIDNPYSLVALIVVKALARTAIANLAKFDLTGLEGTVSNTLATAQKVAEEAVVKAKEKLDETAEKAKEVVSDILKSPFGEKE